MKAMVLAGFKVPLTWKDVPDPTFTSSEIIIRVLANGLCATDLKIVDGLVPTVALPHVLGHEVSGEVVEVGSEVKGLRAGDHVTVYPTQGCGICDYCRLGQENYCLDAPRTGFEIDGGFSEYMRVRGRNAVKVGTDVPIEEAAIVPDALASVYHALIHKARILPGENVAIVGLGGLGIHAVQMARIMGASVIAADVVPEKLQAAMDFGADAQIHSGEEDMASTLRSLTGGLGVDVVIECVGGNSVSEVLKDSIAGLKLGGRLVVMGYAYDRPLSVDSADLIYGQWSILGTRASNLQDVVEVVRLVESGQLKPVISERLPLQQASEGIDSLRERSPLGRTVLVS